MTGLKERETKESHLLPAWCCATFICGVSSDSENSSLRNINFIFENDKTATRNMKQHTIGTARGRRFLKVLGSVQIRHNIYIKVLCRLHSTLKELSTKGLNA